MKASLSEKSGDSAESDRVKTYDINRRYQKYSIACAIFFVALIIAIFYQTAWSIVSIWIRSETFAHGFLIIPIVLWMVWGRRHELLQHLGSVERFATLPLILCGLIWLLASLVDVLVVQQYSLVGIIIFGVWGILGSQASKTILFPLAYLLFLVPIGESLVPWLMEFTATFTVILIELTGIPVYREGLFFYLPSGNWSVVEACSGIRYLIASMTLGCLYAYLTYRSIKKRLIFIVASAIVPIIANSLRAYIIVMLGHLSDMKIATGVDHLIYGWVFFGIVISILFLIGNIWRDNDLVLTSVADNINESRINIKTSSLFAMTAVVLVLTTVWPLLAYTLENRKPANPVLPLEMPKTIGDWTRVEAPFPWKPLKGGADNVAVFIYQYKEKYIQLVLHQYLQQSQGSELVPGRELLVADKRQWKLLERRQSVMALTDLHVKETILANRRGEKFMVWNWYRVGSNFSINNYEVKLLEAIEKLKFGRRDGIRLYLSTSLLGDALGKEDAKATMQEFIQHARGYIEESLDRSIGTL